MRTTFFNKTVILILLFANPSFAQQKHFGQTSKLENGENGYARGSDFQLASPTVSHSGIFFENETGISLSLSFENTRIYYSLDGSDPTEESAVYHQPILVKESSTLKAKAFHPECQPSETVSVGLFKLKKTPEIKSVRLTSPPSENYPGTGAQGLFDKQKGSSNFRTDAWLGFNGNDVEIWIEYVEAFSFEKITASMLSEPNSWIFLPSSIEVSTSGDGKEYQQIATSKLALPDQDMPTGMQFPAVSFPRTESRFIKILVKSIAAIPDWHPGKGSPAWLFIDEILIE